MSDAPTNPADPGSDVDAVQFVLDQGLSYSDMAAKLDEILDERIREIRNREHAGTLTTIDAAAARTRVMSAHLGAIRRLRRAYFPDETEGDQS